MTFLPGCRAENFGPRGVFSKDLILVTWAQKNPNSLFKHWNHKISLFFSTNSAKMLITSTTIAAFTSRLEHMLSIPFTIIDVNMSGLPFKMGLV